MSGSANFGCRLEVNFPVFNDSEKEVFRRLHDAQVTLNPKKCSFIKQQIEYLGHVVTPEGTFPGPSKIEVVKNFPTPTSLKELKSELKVSQKLQVLLML